jgi:hypothetical protein
MELTREIVLAEPPGKRLDSWIAEKVMGWRKKTFPGGGGGFTAWVDENEKVMKLISNSTMSETCYRCDYFRPSTDTTAAFEAEEIAIEKDPAMYVHALASAVFGYSQVQDISDIRKMCMLIHATPEQRSKAALLAVMGE